MWKSSPTEDMMIVVRMLCVGADRKLSHWLKIQSAPTPA
jgi:hypothetical protein